MIKKSYMSMLYQTDGETKTNKLKKKLPWSILPFSSSSFPFFKLQHLIPTTKKKAFGSRVDSEVKLFSLVPSIAHFLIRPVKKPKKN
jgi:hypothetical protein